MSMLPETFRELTQPVIEAGGTRICFNLKATTILNWMFIDAKYTYKKDKYMKNTKVDRNLAKCFDFDKFKQLMAYVMTEGESAQRLRQIMAEYRQIDCRGPFMKTGFTNWTGTTQSLAELEERTTADNFKYLSRQMGALLGLVMLNNKALYFGFWA